jgi:hypothetical protein
MPKYKFNRKDCQKWVKNPMINPITGKSLNPKAKTGIYKQLEKLCRELNISRKKSPIKKSPIHQEVKSKKSLSKKSSNKQSTQAWAKHRKIILGRT